MKPDEEAFPQADEPEPPEPVAHAPLEPGRAWHPLGEHLESVGNLAAERVADVIDPEWGRLAGLWHDFGKYAPDWQAFIRSAGEFAPEAHVEEAGQGPRRRGPDHSTAGAILAVRRFGDQVGSPLAFAISGHHGGLPDAEDLKRRVATPEKVNRYESCLAAAPECPSRKAPTFPEWLSTADDPGRLRRSLEFFTRVLFSALVDADFLDTERYFANAGSEEATRRVSSRNSVAPDIADYGRRLDSYLLALQASAPESRVNGFRMAVLQACRAASASSPGVFTLTVPTGGGKTLASLAFGLAHAVQHGHRRIVVALPFTSIIEQTAEIYREAFRGLGADAVLEHHSALDPDRATAKGRVASENWDAPLIVTTQVQLFESLFANHPGRCRRVHSLIRSVLILDEVQSLPTNLLEPILDVLNELAANYGVTVVMMTATQPALHRRELGGAVFRGLNLEPREIIPPELAGPLWKGLRRVTVHWPKEESDASKADPPRFWADLSARLLEHEQVLAIVHLKLDAQHLWNEVFRQDPDSLHLSAAMCPEHRSGVIREVKRRLAYGRRCRLVTTQVVEAGIDIDFPVVYRAMAGFESLAQSAGRCNREGRLNTGELFVFRAPTLPPRNLRLHHDIAELMLGAERSLDLFDREVFRRYFDRLHSQRNLDGPGVQDARSRFCFEEAARLFRMIDGSATTVFVPFDDRATSLLERLRFGGPTRGLLRGLQRYAVGVYPKQFESLRRVGAVEEVGEDSGLWALCSDLHYHPALGLRVAPDPSEALII